MQAANVGRRIEIRGYVIHFFCFHRSMLVFDLIDLIVVFSTIGSQFDLRVLEFTVHYVHDVIYISGSRFLFNIQHSQLPCTGDASHLTCVGLGVSYHSRWRRDISTSIYPRGWHSLLPAWHSDKREHFILTRYEGDHL